VNVPEPEQADGTPVPNQGNMTDGRPPPDTQPWPNPSGGLITEGDPPGPSLVTGADAAGLAMPVGLIWRILIAMAFFYA
jgi:hypothetical protein